LAARNKQVKSFKNIDLKGFSGTFGKLARHYQSRKSEPSPVTDAFLTHLSGLQNLTHLEFGECPAITGATMANGCRCHT